MGSGRSLPGTLISSAPRSLWPEAETRFLQSKGRPRKEGPSAEREPQPDVSGREPPSNAPSTFLSKQQPLRINCVCARGQGRPALPSPRPPRGPAQAGTGVAAPNVWKSAQRWGQLRAQDEEEPWEPQVAWWWGGWDLKGRRAPVANFVGASPQMVADLRHPSGSPPGVWGPRTGLGKSVNPQTRMRNRVPTCVRMCIWGSDGLSLWSDS